MPMMATGKMIAIKAIIFSKAVLAVPLKMPKLAAVARPNTNHTRHNAMQIHSTGPRRGAGRGAWGVSVSAVMGRSKWGRGQMYFTLRTS